MTNPDVEHLGIMAYAANLQWVTPRAPLSDAIAVHLESTSGRVGEPVSSIYRMNLIHFVIEFMLENIGSGDINVRKEKFSSGKTR